MSLEHPYRGLYLDQQFRASLRNGRTRKPQAVRLPLSVSWAERLIGVTLIVGAGCALALSLALMVGVVWVIAVFTRELLRWLGV